MYHALFLKCRRCERPFEVRMFGLYSGLGPSVIECSFCGKEIDTGRLEWADMSAFTRVYFMVISLLYVGMFALIGGNLLDDVYQMSQQVPTPEHLRFDGSSFQSTAIACGIAVVVIQLYRLAKSVRRSRSGRKMKTREFLLGLEMNMQSKLLCTMILVWLAAKFIYG